MIKNIFILLIIFLISSCSFTTLIIEGKGDIKLKQVDFNDLQNWQKDDQNKAVISLVNSCHKMAKMGDNTQIGGQIGNITVGDFRDVCDIAEVIKGMGSRQARNFFENWFVPFAIENSRGSKDGLFTGYYEPELRGSKTQSAVYQYPIYARPHNLKGSTYYTREEINNGILKNQGLELFYVADKVDLLFMHIQGSGRVILEDGTIVNLAFDGKNNQPYSSIGKYMIQNNIIDTNHTSYFAIKDWLKSHPDEADKIINTNKSYIFFKKSTSDYVTGSEGAPLMPERSLAVDTDIMPLGFPIWLDSKMSNQPYQKLMVSQDTGSAIKGAVRGDVFFGRGRNAEMMAANMNHKGHYYILLPVNVVDKFSQRSN